jgi:hypothetical protein
VEFRKEEKRNAYRMLMEKPLESTAWKTETNMRRWYFEIYLREANCEKEKWHRILSCASYYGR